MHRHQALCLLKMGCTYQAMGDYGAAADQLRESFEIFRQLQPDHYAVRAHEAMSACRNRQRVPRRTSTA
jgi:hypothetical protein